MSSDSSTSRPCVATTRASAPTRSPSRTRTTSPGDELGARGRPARLPSRITADSSESDALQREHRALRAGLQGEAEQRVEDDDRGDHGRLEPFADRRRDDRRDDEQGRRAGRPAGARRCARTAGRGGGRARSGRPRPGGPSPRPSRGRRARRRRARRRPRPARARALIGPRRRTRPQRITRSVAPPRGVHGRRSAVPRIPTSPAGGPRRSRSTT